MIHCVIPDTQIKSGQNLDFLTRIGKYILNKKPDVIIQLGDFIDMESLSFYDKGTKNFEGRRYKKDIEAAHAAMFALLSPIYEFNKRAKKNKEKQYWPRLVLTLGNHEDRINRLINEDPKLEGIIQLTDLPYWEHGFEVYPYLEVVNIDGINYSHYFTSGVMGRPVPNARQLLIKKHQSCVMGHVQTMDIATDYRADGTPITGLFAGCCYEHNESYLGPQGNAYFRGIHMLYEVNDGAFYHHAVTLKYLEKKYAN